MPTHADWAGAYARQAKADFAAFQAVQPIELPECHKLQFLQMACEKLVKSHLWAAGSVAQDIDTTHAVIAKHLHTVLKQCAVSLNFKGAQARTVLQHARRLAEEIDVLAPAVDRGGRRPDNCEYPWENGRGVLHSPLDWRFVPSQLLLVPAGRGFLKLLAAAIAALPS